MDEWLKGKQGTEGPDGRKATPISETGNEFCQEIRLNFKIHEKGKGKSKHEMFQILTIR